MNNFTQNAGVFGCDDWDGWTKTETALDLQLNEEPEGIYTVGPRPGVQQHDTGVLLEKTVSDLTIGKYYRYSVTARSLPDSSAALQLNISDVFGEAPTVLSGGDWQLVQRIFQAKQQSHTISIEAAGQADTKVNAFEIKTTQLSLTKSIVEDFNNITPTPTIKPGGFQQTEHVRISLGADEVGRVLIHSIGAIPGMTEGMNVCMNDGSIAKEHQTVRYDLSYDCLGVKFSLTNMDVNGSDQAVTFYSADGRQLDRFLITVANSWVDVSYPGELIRAFEVRTRRRTSLDFLTMILD